MSGRQYEVNSIVGKKVESGKVYYKVHWTGYSNKHDSWEPQSALVKCKDMIDAYMESQKKTVPKAVLLSSDEEGAPSSRTRSKGGSSKPKSRVRGYPRNRRSQAQPPAKPAVTSSTPDRDTATPHQKKEQSVLTTPQVGSTYNLRHTAPHLHHDHVAITSPQNYSTPHNLRRHPLNQHHHHHISATTPEVKSSPYGFQRVTLHQQNESVSRAMFSTPLLSSDEENELDVSAKPSRELNRRQLKSATKVVLPPRPVAAAKPAKTPTQVQKLPKVPPKPTVTQKQTKQLKPKEKPKAVVPNESPGWMHLGWAEFFLALVVVAFITLSLWLYQQKVSEST